MTADEKNEHTPDEQEPTSGEPTAESPADERATQSPADEPTAESPADERAAQSPGEPPTAPQPAAGAEPGPEDPRGPQAPQDEAPTVTLGGGGGGQGPGPAPVRRLTRSRENRVIGGVCGGLGRYFGTDPVFFRIGAVVLALIGGAGVLLYLAALLLMPAGDSAGAAAAPGPTAATGGPGEGRNRALVVAGVVVLLLVAWPFLLGGGLLIAGILIPLAFLVAAGVVVWWLVSGEGPSGDAGDIARRAALGVGVLILCGVVAIAGAWAAAAGGGTVVAILVIGSGVAIVAGAFLKPVRWLVLPAVTLALSAGVISAAGIDLDGGVGQRSYTPASTADLRDRYEIGLGELKIDLRNTDLPTGDTPLAIDVGVGHAVLVVPEDVCVATSGTAGMGNIGVFNNDNGGIDVDVEVLPEAPSGTSRLVLDADVGVGEIQVRNTAPEYFRTDNGDDFGAWFDENSGDLGSNDACLDTSENATG